MTAIQEGTILLQYNRRTIFLCFGLSCHNSPWQWISVFLCQLNIENKSKSFKDNVQLVKKIDSIHSIDGKIFDSFSDNQGRKNKR